MFFSWREFWKSVNVNDFSQSKIPATPTTKNPENKWATILLPGKPQFIQLGQILCGFHEKWFV